MYSIKIMSGENLADSDVAKGFKMILVDEGDHFEFGHNAQGEPIVTVNAGKGDNRGTVYPVTGNAYVMSETGKTVASFWARKKIHLTLDANDPKPEVTVDMCQKLILEYARQSFPLGDEPVETIRVDVITDERNNRGFAWSVEVTPPSGVTVYPPEKLKQMSRPARDKAYRANVSARMQAGWTSETACQVEAYIIQ